MTTVFLRTKSRTPTLPAVTLVRVPLQRSSVSQVVPRTLAEENRPTVRNDPAPDPHRWRTVLPLPSFFLLRAASLGLRGARGQPLKRPPNRNRFANARRPS